MVWVHSCKRLKDIVTSVLSGADSPLLLVFGVCVLNLTRTAVWVSGHETVEDLANPVKAG
jgi:hypothetical protein